MSTSTNRPVLGDISSRANERLASIFTQPQAGTKRKATEEAPSIDLDDIDIDGLYMDANCDQVRRKIRRVIDNGEMNVGQFADAIGVSRKSLNGFLGKNGKMEGHGFDAYGTAWAYFKKRELAGVKLPTAKKAKPAAVAGAAAGAPVTDLRGIALSGEAMDGVPVYDSCDEVRKKINAHLCKPGVVQAQFCRDLATQLHTRVQKIQSKQLTDFRNKKGPGAGNTSVVYYTAYVYFEKMRLAEGKPKSKHRVGMEDAWPNGFNIDRPQPARVLCSAGAQPFEDAYGRITVRR